MLTLYDALAKVLGMVLTLDSAHVNMVGMVFDHETPRSCT